MAWLPNPPRNGHVGSQPTVLCVDSQLRAGAGGGISPCRQEGTKQHSTCWDGALGFPQFYQFELNQVGKGAVGSEQTHLLCDNLG